jgi:metal-sulfur cluster biosynthetic enzyme
MSDVIKAEVEQKLAALPDVREVHVEIVFDPPWNPGMMSEGARLHLGFDSDYGAANAKPGPPNSGSSNSGPFKVIR